MRSVAGPEVTEVRPGEELDWASLEAYLRRHLPQASGAFSVLQFPNGSANLTYLVRFGDARPRRTPAAVRRDRNRRARHAPGAHRAVAAARGLPAGPAGPALLRRRVDHRRALPGLRVPVGGRGVGPGSRAAVGGRGPGSSHRASPWWTRWRICIWSTRKPAASATSAAPTGYLERQLGGWQRRWEAVAIEGRGTMDRVGELLARHLPTSGRPALVHNDFKVDNCQFAAGSPDVVTSVFDWDMATLGDPLTDLGTLLNYWPDGATPADGVPGVENVGLPGRDEVVARYAARTGQDLTRGDVAWYEAFGCWKTAVIMQQLYVRHLRGESSDDRMTARGEQVVRIADRALALAETLG